MLAFTDSGRGPAVLLIHGFPLNRNMWRSQVDALSSAGYRAVAPDLPGFGGSSPLSGPVTMQRYAQSCVELLDSLEIDQAMVCGMSMGGYVLLSLLDHYPQRVSAAGFIVTRAAADDEDGRSKRTELAGTARSEGAQPVADIFSDLVFAEATLAQHPELVAKVRRWMLSADPEGVAAALEAMRERNDYSTRLAEFAQPALVIGAEEDRAIPLSQSQHLAQGLPDAELVAIPGAGHMANLEQSEIFNRALLDFLQRRIA